MAIFATVLWKYRQPYVSLTAPPSCDLHRQACSASDGTVVITLAMQPQPIPSLKPVALSVRVQGMRADTVSLAFSGVDMFMGYNAVELQPTGEQFSGVGVLPVCTVDKMRWAAVVSVTGAGQSYRAAFQFEVAR